jgi:hypothetical protein
MRRFILPALALAFVAAPASRAQGGAGVDKVLPFIADDYGRALAQAREQRLPLFIEAWAPW